MGPTPDAATGGWSRTTPSGESELVEDSARAGISDGDAVRVGREDPPELEERVGQFAVVDDEKIVRGFRDEDELLEVTAEIRGVLGSEGLDDAVVGIRGSAVTGASSKGGEFRWRNGGDLSKASDVDFFFTSPSLEAKLKRRGARFVGGRIKPDELAAFCEDLMEGLDAWSAATAARIGRGADATLLSADLVNSLDPNEMVLFE